MSDRVISILDEESFLIHNMDFVTFS